MRLHEQLARRLAKTAYLVLDGLQKNRQEIRDELCSDKVAPPMDPDLPHNRVSDRFEVDRSFIREVVEHVGCTHCFWTCAYVKRSEERQQTLFSRIHCEFERNKILNTTEIKTEKSLH